MIIASIKQLFTYPIKGLTPQPCDQAILTEGHGIKGDRAFALMFEDAQQQLTPNSHTVPWMSKKHFAVQNDWPGLAALTCDYNAQTQELRVWRQGVELLVADVNTAREQISTFFTGYLAALQPSNAARHPQHTPLRWVGDSSGNTRYPDREPVHISLLSQGTLDQLSQVSGVPIESRRFRPNIVLEGVAPWEEFNWVGKTFDLGAAKIEVNARIGRCVNIEVNPDTGNRDMPLLTVLQQKFGHAQTGVLAKIVTSGTVAIGDSLKMS